MVGAALLLLLAAAALARADAAPAAVPDGAAGAPGDGSGGWWTSVGILTGSTQLDANLADYQWDTRPQMAWGAEARHGRGRFAGGLRLWRTQTTQQMDAPGVTSAPVVHSTSLELLAQGRIVEGWGTRLLASASAGRLFLGYSPDQVTIDLGGGSGPTEVALSPVQEWIVGGGLSLERALGVRWSMSLEVDRRVFALDTAHRNGAVIETGRESFGEWSARLGFARLFNR